MPCSREPRKSLRLTPRTGAASSKARTGLYFASAWQWQIQPLSTGCAIYYSLEHEYAGMIWLRPRSLCAITFFNTVCCST